MSQYYCHTSKQKPADCYNADTRKGHMGTCYGNSLSGFQDLGVGHTPPDVSNPDSYLVKNMKSCKIPGNLNYCPPGSDAYNKVTNTCYKSVGHPGHTPPVLEDGTFTPYGPNMALAAQYLPPPQVPLYPTVKKESKLALYILLSVIVLLLLITLVLQVNN